MIFYCNGCGEWRPRFGAKSVSLYGGEAVRCATCSGPITVDEAIDLHIQLDTMSEEQLKAAIADFTRIW